MPAELRAEDDCSWTDQRLAEAPVRVHIDAWYADCRPAGTRRSPIVAGAVAEARRVWHEQARWHALAGAIAAVLGTTVLALGDPALALDKVTFGTNWKAQAEHGGFYQAVADGIYAKHGLDVTIRQGGPQVNHSQLLAAGKIDFNMGGNLFGQFNYTQDNVPMVTIAAIFQKEPQVLLAHPDAGVDELADLDEQDPLHRQRRPADLLAVAEAGLRLHGRPGEALHLQPGAVPGRQELGPAGLRHLRAVRDRAAGRLQAGGADDGRLPATTPTRPRSRPRRSWSTRTPTWCSASSTPRSRAGTTISTATTTPANALIKADNPEMTDEQIAFSIDAMKKYGIVDSGDAQDHGHRRHDRRALGELLHQVGRSGASTRPDLPLQDRLHARSSSTRAHGLDLRKQLTGE